ncbi:universal stress protein [Chryseolinea lacunae]|uniref:Universal stress protein n=1 Tax=Chryseolinea lacunae TaxID=2801331 RepID=A0ABS1KM16_9BACT|nr:universal stress protein [Chryseolinea lacunae]MBL0740505.1 universal stress protein [Chryseolinea lacunae]
MTKDILCTIDFSEASRQALKWAVQFSKTQHANLIILYTYRLTKNMNGEVVVWKKKMEEEAQQKFISFESDFLKASGVHYDFKIEVGFVSDRIEDHIQKNEVSFLVMDKNMCASSKDTFDDLVEHINVPLVVIP